MRLSLFKNIRSFREFTRRVEFLWAPDFEDRELEEFPTCVTGGFAPWRLREFLNLAKLHPEYHIVVCIEPDLYVNAFIAGAQSYHLAEGDSDPSLVHDPNDRLDAHFLQSLNSGRNRRLA